MISDATKNYVRNMIYSVFMLHIRSRSFDYSDIRVQSSAPSSAPIPISTLVLDGRAYVAAIRELAPHQSAWVRWAYADRHPTAANDDMEIIARHVWDNYRSTLQDLTETQEIRLMLLVQPALEQVQRVNRLGKKRYKRTDLYEITGCPESSWQRDLQPHWKALQDCIRTIDSTALNHLFYLFEMVEHKKALGSANDIAANTQMRMAG